MNYKIKVGSEAESEEAQCLFFELGGCWATCGRSYNDMVELGDYVFLTDSSMLNYGLGIGKEEITIPQLKDMVVLKRNDVSDATHTDQYGDKWAFLLGEWNFYTGEKKWDSALSGLMSRYELKPITKEPVMKEYLNKLEDGTYKLVLLDSVADGVEGLIEVPDGSDIAFQAFSNSPVVFKRSECGYSNAVIVWQRETLNDKVASAEVARQEFIGAPFSDLPEFNFEVFEVADVVDESNVEQTLSGRESTYGSFKDVAVTTRNLMNCIDVDSMSAVQQEALHMICSKLARIANGDPNHVDSWHDIAGYASLVVKDINGNP